MTRVKGIVLETSNNQATILTEQGEFKNVKIRQPIHAGEIWQGSPMLAWKYACAAAVLLLLMAGSVDFFSVQAYAQVSSGIELGLNRWDRVVTVKALNINSKQQIGKLGLKGKKVEEAVQELAKSGLDNSNQKRPAVTVTTKKPGNEKVKQRIEEKIDNKVKGVINKKQPSAKEEKYKPNNSKVFSGKLFDSRQEKDYIKYNGKKSKSYERKPQESFFEKNRENNEKTLPRFNVPDKVNNRDKSRTRIKEKNSDNILRAAPLKNSTQFHQVPQKNQRGKSNNNKNSRQEFR